jgi:DNA repair protein RadC
MATEATYTLIRDMPPDQRPRERLEQYGPAALNVNELMAIILRVGNARTSAIELANQLMREFDGLRNLAGATVHELSQSKGIGLAKACQLQAAFELGKRLAATTQSIRPTIGGPADAANLVMEEMRYFKEEHYRVLFLDSRHSVIAHRDITIGTLNASIVHPRETFRAAVGHAAAAIILAHNHPSGDPTPSTEDLTLTARLKQAGEIMGIPVLDHIVIGDNRWVSLKERGLV